MTLCAESKYFFAECIVLILTTSTGNATKTPRAERAARGRSPGNHRPTDAGDFINFQENDKTSRIRPRSQDLLM